MTIDELLMRLDLGEDQDIEFKSADGGLPKSLWETLSAFANTEGGFVVLGVTQHDERFSVSGVRNPEGLIKTFWDSHNNSQKLSAPVCSQSDVRALAVDGRKVVVIHVPMAARTQRPVFINGNPITGSYKRNFEGDYRCTPEEVRQMLRDASDEPQDLRILDTFDMADLDAETLKAFRQRFASVKPDHPFLALEDKELLHRLGGWHRDRASGREGLTIAGLIMFGRERSILDALPHYHLDYQEQLSADPDKRWTYRLTIDGTWEPNLFNFYYRVYGRLVSNLDVPFQLDKGAVRRDETHVHEALREALVNTLIHADHQSSRPITIIKRPDMFSFSNPGRLRIPMARLYDGGVSDPRNPNLQKMFQMLGLGEKAGSGFQKILRAWNEQQWLIPLVSEKLDLDMTTVALPMMSLIPKDVEKELREIVGDTYAALSELDRLVLVLAHHFGEVSNSHVQRFSKEHPRDIGDRLKYLTDHGWLKRSGHGRGSRYTLGGREEHDLFGVDSQHNEPSSQHNEPSSQHNEPSSQHFEDLVQRAYPVSSRRRASKDLVIMTILSLCDGRFLTLRTLSELLHRSPDSVMNHYVSLLVKKGRLELRYPGQPNHPQQGYRSRKSHE